MNIFKTAFKNEIKEVKLTSLNDFNTSDGYAYSANVLLNNKKVGTISHQGDGGEPNMIFVKGGDKRLNDYINEKGLREKMFDSGWEFMGSSNKIDDVSVLDTIVAEELNLRDFMKDVRKYQSKNIVIGNEKGGGLSTRGWKHTIKKLVDAGHKDKLQLAITKMVSELEEGEVILNTNLTKLGLTV